ncbi:MAG: AmmeMemoRadiSam system radical SAM enzyme [Candidatus Aminicenantia bacterium]
MKEAMFWEKMENGKVRCELCRHRCVIYPDKLGACGVRVNKNSTLYTLVWGKPVAVHIDPIEKKPLFHFLPGTSTFSVATVGCNFRCLNCQNWEISQSRFKEEEFNKGKDYFLPEEVVKIAMEKGCKSISYTYTEPTIFFEWAYDISKLAWKDGIFNIFVTNGYMTERAILEISPYLHAANVDLKSFRKEFYHKVAGARLEGVLESLKIMKKLKIWVEVTTLLIPGMNDSEGEIKDIANFIKNELGEGTPWHISRFYPHFKMNKIPPTPSSTLKRAREIGLMSGLKYVYTGNVPGDEGENTYCPNCHKVIIKRYGFSILGYNIKNGFCNFCGEKIHGFGF